MCERGDAITPSTHEILHRRGFERSISVVEQLDPAIGQEFVRTTEVVMRDVLASSNEEARWTGGLLNCNGAPIEFSFATFADDLRYTMDVGGPETPPQTRLARIDSILDELGSEGSHREITRRFGQAQEGASASLRWGAWLGIRHRKKDPGTSYKIYAETPAETSVTELLAEYLNGAPVLSGPAPQLVLAGMSTGSDRCEFYFEWPTRRLELKDIGRLLAHVGLEHRKMELLGLMREFDFREESSSADALPEAQYGFSYSVLPRRREPLFTIFAFAADLAGGDALVRRQVLVAARKRGWTLGGYASLTEPVAKRFFRSTYHNIISFVVGEAPMTGLQISLSPPPLLPDEDR